MTIRQENLQRDFSRGRVGDELNYSFVVVALLEEEGSYVETDNTLKDINMVIFKERRISFNLWVSRIKFMEKQ